MGLTSAIVGCGSRSVASGTSGEETVGKAPDGMLGAPHVEPNASVKPPSWFTAAPIPHDPSAILPGVVGGGIAVFAPGYGDMDVITIGTDGKPWRAGDFDAGSWADPSPAQVEKVSPERFVPGGGVAAVSRVPDILETYAIGYDGRLWNIGTTQPVNSDWRDPFPPNPNDPARFKPGGGIAAVSRNTSILDTFVIGSNGHLWESGAWDDTKGAWQPAFQVLGDGVFPFGGGVAAVASDANHLYTFAIGPDGHLWCAGAWDENHWIPSYEVVSPGLAASGQPFAVGSQLAATVRDHSVLDVWVIGPDGQLWNAGSCDVSSGACNGAWSLPYKPSPQSDAVFKVGGGIAAVSRMPVHLDVLAIGNNQRTWEVGWWGVLCGAQGFGAGPGGCCLGLLDAVDPKGGDVCAADCGGEGQYPCVSGGCAAGFVFDEGFCVH
ncbi:MAG TPA: hypothetical protein VGI39_45190 [Polyangiaceae bacterium]